MSERFSHIRGSWVQAVALDTDLSHGACRLATLLAHKYADRDTGEAWPSFERLADDLSSNSRTISRYVSELEAMGWITVDRGRYRGKSSVYRLCLDRAPSVVKSIGKTEVGKGDNSDTHSVGKGRQDYPEWATNQSAKGRHKCPPNLNREPKKEPFAREAGASEAAKPWRQYTVGGTVKVRRDTPQGKAWSQFLRSRGYHRRWPGNGGTEWCFPTEWPPNADAEAV